MPLKIDVREPTIIVISCYLSLNDCYFFILLISFFFSNRIRRHLYLCYRFYLTNKRVYSTIASGRLTPSSVIYLHRANILFGSYHI